MIAIKYKCYLNVDDTLKLNSSPFFKPNIYIYIYATAKKISITHILIYGFTYF